MITPRNHQGRRLDVETGADAELEVKIPDFRGAAVIFLSLA
jgi:hypothetical protein